MPVVYGLYNYAGVISGPSYLCIDGTCAYKNIRYGTYSLFSLVSHRLWEVDSTSKFAWRYIGWDGGFLSCDVLPWTRAIHLQTWRLTASKSSWQYGHSIRWCTVRSSLSWTHMVFATNSYIGFNHFWQIVVQRVVIDGVLSNPIVVSSGVVQGQYSNP